MRPIWEFKRELYALPFDQTESILYFAPVEQARKDAIAGLTQELPRDRLKIYVKAPPGLGTHFPSTSDNPLMLGGRCRSKMWSGLLSGLEPAMVLADCLHTLT